MADHPPLYSLPVADSALSQRPLTGKRKRKHGKAKDSTPDDDLVPDNSEYSAVITPEERLQRRLAGQPLNEPPPAFPFPHAATSSHEPSKHERIADSANATHSSLRVQHLSAMMALLHRCLEERDYKRAARALGLILRTELHGKTIELRHAGLWGMGAEILLRMESEEEPGSISRQGFEKAKLYYNRMALQYPWHRSWPNVVNAQDFKTAMFGLWIYLVCHEAEALKKAAESELATYEHSTPELQAKRWELTEAENIAQEMDSLMSSLPFMDDVELIRLRGMVALWTADLVDALDSADTEAGVGESLLEQDMERAWLGEETLEPGSDNGRGLPQSSQRAMDARSLANAMFSKLGRERDQEGSSSRSSDISNLDVLT